MLVVRIELWPMGDSRGLEQLDAFTITNLDPWVDQCRYEVRRGNALVLVQHDRRDGPLVLVKAALEALLPIGSCDLERSGRAVLDALMPVCEHVPFDTLWEFTRALGDPRASDDSRPGREAWSDP